VYVRNVLAGDLGTSFVHGQPVARVVADRLPATLLLMSVALAASTALGIALGAAAARRVHRPATCASAPSRWSAAPRRRSGWPSSR
jgi:peptide/nickel transport system permease protein